LTNKTHQSETWKLFAGLFITGGFLFTFGGFVPSWDSAYYPLMMSQNIRYKEYLRSKWWLIVIVTFVSMLLASFYLFMGWEVYQAIIAAGIYNIGVNAHLVLLGGAYVKTPIDLTTGRKVFGDKKAFNVQTLIIALPKLVLPLLIFYIFYRKWNVTAGYLSVAILGILGLAFRNKMFRIIENIYKKEKYSTLAAYKQKN
jgi:multisubunit Na+/H+ antiporter MnhC subunit